MNEKDAILEAMQELPDWEDPPLARVRFRLQQRGLQVITNAAIRAALKGSADCPSEVATARIEQDSGVRQLFPSFHQTVVSLVHSATAQTLLVICPSLFSLQTLCPKPRAQHGSGQRQSNRRMVIAGAFSPGRDSPC